ncbi:phage replication O, N-terminal -containing domain protein [Pseudomonas aeruginosa]|nr:phage replication O, N-terminal -containing domain protein [Pseudomonas aeruginosa]AWE83567.1 phage replication O, N-terminal -containing domain protein [Pseudomonas aeruginosa]AWE86436.1 phage replication O, N-terminal -containing domain protein [Pseudomonas aeruginosa]PRW06461.1 phage replication O, N-terminal -containing domain protein [Pseudomonas aeruginosa]PRW08918.1 phage replication O, N-terminal -containing domain protein [Pseudomonas aeruginosa]
MKASPFLMGKVPGRNGAKPFRATFDWLIAPSNFVKVVEGNYHA